MILLLGGTANVGSRLTPLLRARGLPVRLLARHENPASRAAVDSGAELVIGDVRDEAARRQALDGVDTVVSAMTGFGGLNALGSGAIDRDGNLALIESARRAGVEHVVLLSIHGASATHPIALFRDKRAAEEALRAIGLDWTILRPTAFLETWMGLLGSPLVATGKTRVFGTGRNRINFVSASDVARFAELALTDASLRGTAVEIPGPENLSFDELLDIVEREAGVRGQRQYLPAPMMRLARLATRLPKPVLSAQIGAAIVMNERDMTVDGPALRAAYPSIPMTTAAEVARAQYHPSPAAAGITPGTLAAR
jgi:NADH dehydrogenase